MRPTFSQFKMNEQQRIEYAILLQKGKDNLDLDEQTQLEIYKESLNGDVRRVLYYHLKPTQNKIPFNVPRTALDLLKFIEGEKNEVPPHDQRTTFSMKIRTSDGFMMLITGYIFSSNGEYASGWPTLIPTTEILIQNRHDHPV
jgi:hypothetical protein